MAATDFPMTPAEPPVRLVDLIKRELRARGYAEVEPSPNGGGVWESPDGGVDQLVPTIIDCLDRESA